MSEVVVYGRSYPPCSGCNDVKSYLDSQGIKYRYKDISQEDNYNEFCNKRLRSIPAVFVGEDFVGNYQDTVKYFKNL